MLPLRIRLESKSETSASVATEVRGTEAQKTKARLIIHIPVFMGNEYPSRGNETAAESFRGRGPEVSVQEYAHSSFANDLQEKIGKVPAAESNKTKELIERFRAELLDLFVPEARQVPLNHSQILYLREVISSAFLFSRDYSGAVLAFQDKEKLLVVATYVNSLTR
jgi:hypothetical protein